jgi:hypothetical protein
MKKNLDSEDYYRYAEWQKHYWEVENMYKEQTNLWAKEGLLVLLKMLNIYPKNSETNKNQTE